MAETLVVSLQDVLEILKNADAKSLSEHRKRMIEKHKKRKLTQLNFDHIPIEEQIVVLFPGQGAQHVGMGSKVSLLCYFAP